MRRVFFIGATLTLVLAGLVARPAMRERQAAQLLARFVSADSPADIEEMATTFGDGVAARVYRAHAVASPKAIVLLHGMHHAGIDEARLIHFARTLAASGFEVLTPQLAELADYRVDARTIDTIGAAVLELSNRHGGQPVGLMGLSFAGGLALCAAADERFAAQVRYVVAVGAHDDLARVSRFLVTDEIDRPDGSKAHLAAHPYGSMVLVYAHAGDFFSALDVEPARAALREWLWDEKDKAQALTALLSPDAKQKVEDLVAHRLEPLRPALLACIERNAASLESVSPATHLHSLRAPAFLLHGEGDTVIPAVETLWLAHDVPPHVLRSALVSPALQHVELQGQPSLFDQLELVHFMAQLIGAADGRD